jgi:hypothetical protein
MTMFRVDFVDGASVSSFVSLGVLNGYRPASGNLPVMASSAALPGPSGFSLLLIRTISTPQAAPVARRHRHATATALTSASPVCPPAQPGAPCRHNGLAASSGQHGGEMRAIASRPQHIKEPAA